MSTPHSILSSDALTGRGIGVSGGGTHLGRAIALSLAAAGAEVVVFGRRTTPLQPTAQLALELSGNIHTEIADQHEEEDLERVLDRITKEAGRVHGWVNNACSGPRTLLGDLDREAVENTLESTLSDVILATDAVASRMMNTTEGQGGAIVNVASMYGVISPQPHAYDAHPEFHNPPAYGAAKAGVIEFTRYAACHYGRNNVRVNCVSPGPFPTAAVQEERDFVAELEKRVPLGRIGQAFEIGGPVAFLLSPLASFVTGQNLMVDGGWTAW